MLPNKTLLVTRKLPATLMALLEELLRIIGIVMLTR